MSINTERLLILNQLVQALPLHDREPYLLGLGAVYQDLKASPHYFVDERDYNIYSIRKIGEQYWLGENLRYQMQGRPWVKNKLSYGCLYAWDELEEAIPEGFFVPSDEDWKELEAELGMPQQELDGWLWRGTTQGDVLKNPLEWEEEGGGSNLTGFSAFPAGFSDMDMQDWAVGRFAYFWTNSFDSPLEVIFRALHYIDGRIFRMHVNRVGSRRSCRCLLQKNSPKP